MDNPRRLLSGLLFGNMLVNVSFFTLASVINFKVQHQYGVTAATISAGISLGILVLAGEMFPKSLAYANSKTLSILAAMPVFMWLRLIGPILSFFEASHIRASGSRTGSACQTHQAGHSR